MPTQTRRPHAGFTLIELLTVIAIIGLLAAIIFPAIGTAQNNVKKALEGTNLRTIGQAAIAFGNDTSEGALPDPQGPAAAQITGGDRLHVWMAQLARAGLNDPKLYWSKIDPKNPFPVDAPVSILNPDNKRAINQGITKYPIMFDVVGGLRTSDPSTAPIGFTRGLRKDGDWDKDKAPYADTGGFVVFLGGNLEKFDSINNKLTNTRGKPTSNILQAIPNNAKQNVYGMNSVIGTPGGTPPENAQ